MGVVKKIIMLHGWTYSLDKWDKFLECLEKLGFGADLLEIPGLTEKSDKIWNLEDYVDWLHGKIDSYQDKVILLGHSNGGRIAVAYAAKYPEYLESLVLIDSAVIYHNDMFIRTKRFVFRTLAKLGKKLINSDTLRKTLYLIVGEKDYEKASPTMRQTMANLISRDLTSELKNIIVSTLIIWGKEDKLTPVSDGILINRLIKNSKFKILDNAGHSPFYTNPEEVANIIKDDI